MSFRASFMIIAAVAATANTVQVAAAGYLETGDALWLGAVLGLCGVALVLALVLFVRRGGEVVRGFASLRFASAVLVGLLFATMTGTVILQQVPPQRFAETYGGLAPALTFLHLDHIFASYSFGSLLLLLALSLLATVSLRVRSMSLRARSVWRNAGFLLVHVGALVVILGGLLSRVGGDKGMVELHEGQAAAQYVRRAPGPREAPLGDLGFTVRLDRFDLEFHDPAYSLYLLRLSGEVDRKGMSEVQTVAALTTDVGDRRRFKQTAEIEVMAFHLPESIAAHQTPHVLAVGDERRVPVQVGSEVVLAEGLTVEVLRFLPDFAFDVRTRQATSRSRRPQNPAIEVAVRRAGEEEPLRRSWLFGREGAFPVDAHPGADESGHKLGYEYVRPSIEVEVRDGAHVETLRLHQGETLPLTSVDRSYMLAFNEKGNRVKQYHSAVTILEEGREVLSRAPLSVNHPIRYGGFHIYQSNYRWWDLSYSGLMVVRDPGLVTVYVGMVMMLVGIVHALYLRPRRRRTATALETSAEEGGVS